MTCSKCPSGKSGPEPGPDNDEMLIRRILRVCTNFLPEITVLLSSSCCWLPTFLDFLFVGSVTVAEAEYLRNAFLAISITGIIWRAQREGFSRKMLLRIVVCVGMLAWAQYNRRAQVERKASHICH